VQSISVIVLAGGASRRMGTNKALLKLHSGETLIARVVANLRPLSDDLIVVSKTPDLYTGLDVRQASDAFPDSGPLAGLLAGLRAARHPWALAVACDMPLVDHRLVRYMVLLGEGHDAVVPIGPTGEPEPLHALYSEACMEPIEQALVAGQRRMISFFDDIRVRFVEPREIAIFDPEGTSFFNANTPKDWQRLKAMLRPSSKRRGTSQ
jgi:molybdopterin-guanine dinucleotide biosynthesis protein A